MIQSIEKQLAVIEKAKNWIISSLDGNKREEAYNYAINCRRKLNKKKYSLEGNPAAAIYGESQVGKSYLVSSLLSENGKPFSLIGSNGRAYNFIEEINPPGGGSESTSLVSRFSVNYKPVFTDFPIKANLLSPADLILVLCDSFYNDINLKTSSDTHFLSVDEINEYVNVLTKQYADAPKIQCYLEEDDIIDIKEYFENYFQKADRILDSNFFIGISRIIGKIKPEAWKDVMSILWNKNEVFTNLFDSLISEYQKINFDNIIYLPIDAVLYSYGTILDVKRLREIYSAPDRIEQNYTSTTNIKCSISGKELEFSKSYLCALTAELVFSQPESLVQSKPFLKKSDLLDFPGARSRMNTQIEAIENKTIPDLLLRGKVAYLFNKYSDSEKINMLIFCAKHEQTAQRFMPQLLYNWINKVVGDSPEKREQFIHTSKVPPLFIIGTFFNVNMAYDPIRDGKDSSSLSYRWLQRFDTTLAQEYIEVKNPLYSWFDNWTTSQRNFQNIYLLRDFEKSETPSNLFRGYNKYKCEKEEVIPEQDPNFRGKLRESFINYEFVQKHFADPAESWDEAASINKDGTGLIIKKLSTAAENINAARTKKAISELEDIKESFQKELLKYYHSNDKDEELLKAKSIAGDIQLRLDRAFSADGIKQYGMIMRELMIDECTVLNLYRRIVDDIEHREVYNMDIYSTLKIQVPVIEGDTVETYFDRLCAHYEKTSDEQKAELKEILNKEGISIDDLISGHLDLIKNNARQLSEALLDFWLNNATNKNKIVLQRILAENGDPSLDEMVEMFRKLFKKLNLSKRIAEKIRRYVDGHSKTDLPYEIVADISAELLNKCINSVGFEYLDEAEISDLKNANEKNGLGLVLKQQESQDTSIKEMFNRIENWTEIIQKHPEEMRFLPSYRNYIEWYNKLKIGFVSVCDIPNYDIVANDRLGSIISEYNNISIE